MTKITQEKRELIIKYYNDGMWASEIAKKVGFSDGYIRKFLNDIGIFKPKILRNFTLNEDFFENIDTEEKAYILGYLYADGYHHEKTYNIALQLHEMDLHILEEINRIINSNRPLLKIERNDSVYYRLCASSEKLSKDLTNVGCMQAKTHKLTYPTWLREDLHRHFIRGYFDGDGCVWVRHKSEKNTPILYVEMVGTDIFLSEIQKILSLNCNLNNVKLNTRHKERNHNIRHIKYGGNLASTKIFRYLYDDSSIFLTRKKEKFLSVLEKYNYLDISEDEIEKIIISRNKKYNYNGIELNFKEYCERIGEEYNLSPRTVKGRLENGWTIENITLTRIKNGNKVKINQKDGNNNIINSFNSIVELNLYLGLDKHNNYIQTIIKNKKKYKGFYWELG